MLRTRSFSVSEMTVFRVGPETPLRHPQRSVLREETWLPTECGNRAEYGVAEDDRTFVVPRDDRKLAVERTP